MEETIRAALQTIQEQEQVHILYACESGSRAWGFPSRDSDYDVRFIYMRSEDWYLSIDLEQQRDVIERPISEQLDISGWDLRKALQLLRKSNPPLFEWLHSPIVYLEDVPTTSKIRQIIPAYYAPSSCMLHYWHMAEGNYRTYLKQDLVPLKKYFYVLRPLLAIMWIEAGYGIVPMEFATLVDQLVEQPELKHEIELLLERKKRGDELDLGPKNSILDRFIQRALGRFNAAALSAADQRPAADGLNALFRQLVKAKG